MKCIRANGTTDIIRVTEIDAEKKVKSGTHKYVPKSQWKKQKYGEHYQSVEKVREVLPANVEGSEEFNKANTKRGKNKQSKK